VKNDRTAPVLSPDPTRSAALSLLAAVLDRHRPLEDALDSLPPMEARDRAAAHRLAAAALRRRGTIDAVLEPYLARTPPAEGCGLARPRFCSWRPRPMPLSARRWRLHVRATCPSSPAS
jgi:hypothetical protein